MFSPHLSDMKVGTLSHNNFTEMGSVLTTVSSDSSRVVESSDHQSPTVTSGILLGPEGGDRPSFLHGGKEKTYTSK